MTRAACFLSAAQRQQGVAAIEFALMVGILLLIFSGIITFSSLFLAKQKMDHLVGDLSRQATMQVKTADEIAPFYKSGTGQELWQGPSQERRVLALVWRPECGCSIPGLCLGASV